MKYLKMLGLLAVAVGALMAFAGSASATELTSPTGTVYTGHVDADVEGEVILNGAVDIICKEGTVSGNVEKHGSASTVSGKIETLTFAKCNHHVTVLKKGELIVHVDPESTEGGGTLTSKGAEVTIQITTLGISCIYGTPNETDLGTLTSSHETTDPEEHATLDIEANIERIGHSIFCGGTAVWEGSYTVTTPVPLYVS